MKKESVIVLTILVAFVFISGCAQQSVPGKLPAALSGQPYSYAISVPDGNKGPFTCTATPDSVLPSGMSFDGCTLKGTAPTLLGTSEKTFSFKFTITDTNGKAIGTFDATLPVTVGPLEFLPPELPDAEIGQRYLFSFCEVPTALDCSSSSSITGGAGAQYTFYATGLPLGFFLNSNGELSGMIPDGTQEGDKTFRVCAVDSSRVEDCKDMKLTIKKKETRKYKVSLKASQTYHGEVALYLTSANGGYTIVYEDGSVKWEMNDVVITLTKPYSYVLFTSDDYDVKTDEYGYSTADNFRKKQFPMKVSGSTSLSYEFSIPENGECVADSSSGAYDLSVPITLKIEQPSAGEPKLIFDIDEGYWKVNPSIEKGDLSQMKCKNAGGAEYILKSMMAGVADAGLGYVTFEDDGGMKTGQDNNPRVYTYAFSAANAGTNSFEWTLTVERVK